MTKAPNSLGKIKWTRAKKQMFYICQNKNNRFIDQYLWAVKVLGGLVESDLEDMMAARKIFATARAINIDKEIAKINNATLRKIAKKETEKVERYAKNKV